MVAETRVKKSPPDLTSSLVEADNSPAMSTATCQTDPFHEMTPSYTVTIPAHSKQSVSTATCMKHDDPFCFDTEVGPLVEVLVGKCVQQAVLEVEQEHELEATHAAAVRKAHAQQEEVRKLHELEAECVAAHEQQRLRYDQASIARKHRIELEKKVVASSIMQAVVPNVLDECCTQTANLTPYATDLGEFIHRVLPSWYSTIDREIAQQEQGRAILDALIQELVDKKEAL